MKNIIRSNNSILNQKKKYMFLTTVLLIGIITGIIFILFISDKDKNLIKDNFSMTFNLINNHKINYFKSFINSISSNLLTLIIMYILAISIIGIPISVFYLFLKGFSFGLSLSSIINIYGFKGIPLSISYLVPHQIILLIVYILLCFYAINFSIKLFRYLFLKENIVLIKYFKNLNKIFLICLITMIICSIIEVFLTPLLIDLCI